MEPKVDTFHGTEAEKIALVMSVKIVASARQLAGDRGSVDWQQRLGWTPPRSCAKTIEVPKLSPEGVGAVLGEIGFPFASLATDFDIIAELHRLTEGGDPLLLELYINDLLQHPDKTARLRTQDLAKLEPGFGAYFRDWFDHQKEAWHQAGMIVDDDLLNAILAIFACALGPLKLTTLEALLHKISRTERNITAVNLEPLRRFIIGDAVDTGFALGHPKLAEYLQCHHFAGSNLLIQTRRGLLDWCRNLVRDLNAGVLRPEATPEYAMLFYSQHLIRENADPSLFRELIEDGWRRAWEAYEGSNRGFNNDVELTWQQMKQAVTHTSVLQKGQVGLGGQIRCMLCVVSIRNRWQHRVLHADIMNLMLRHGVITSTEALHILELIESDRDRADFLIRLSGNLHSTRIGQAVELACALRDNLARTRALAALTPCLRAAEERQAGLAETLAAAGAIRDYKARAHVLADLAGRLTEAERFSVLPQALAAARAISDDRGRVRALVEVAPLLPDAERLPVVAEALAGARKIRSDQVRAHVLVELAPSLPVEWAPDVLAMARTLGDNEARASALSELASCLPEAAEERQAALTEALAAARAIRDDQARARTLAELVPRLPAKLGREALMAVWTLPCC